ncbi:hypothetical protein GP475_08755 [Corynebacterium poyangense]|uniref:Uncharacterized protein n=1 Tax=Corynebacterium poyangense TaxID=2684405 RepID=A0A7H0SQ91_9CORY|nr:hypothetical protein [Corynebacterium poyangense]QNQ90716.1 hypothetical protein GP475_08755 [Corynebacterium poyangense]
MEGLPENSRFMARLLGEPDGQSFTRSDWLLMDLRNIVEAWRCGEANSKRKKGSRPIEFNNWENYPGYEAFNKLKKKKSNNAILAKARAAAGGWE